jgi:Fe-S-cluster containining protein
MTTSQFPCSSCGSCCRHAYMAKELLYSVGIKLKEDGSCEHLNKDNLCSIYNNRPEFCKVGYSKPNDMSFKDFYLLNAKVCNILMDTDNIPVELRIDEELIRRTICD